MTDMSGLYLGTHSLHVIRAALIRLSISDLIDEITSSIVVLGGQYAKVY
jgi:hypothetical protein